MVVLFDDSLLGLNFHSIVSVCNLKFITLKWEIYLAQMRSGVLDSFVTGVSTCKSFANSQSLMGDWTHAQLVVALSSVM